MRMIEIIALGAQLRREAEKRCPNVNEAHLRVHEVMATAFADEPGLVTSDALEGELYSRLRLNLDGYSARSH
jgi:hypothetical protein